MVAAQKNVRCGEDDGCSNEVTADDVVPVLNSDVTQLGLLVSEWCAEFGVDEY